MNKKANPTIKIVINLDLKHIKPINQTSTDNIITLKHFKVVTTKLKTLFTLSSTVNGFAIILVSAYQNKTRFVRN